MTQENTASSSAEKQAVHLPRVDVVEGANAVTVTLDMPGVAQSDLEVTLEQGVLSVAARRVLAPKQGGRMLHQEFGAATLERSFSLSKDLDAEKIDATLKDGVLILTIPRAQRSGPHKVEIRGKD